MITAFGIFRLWDIFIQRLRSIFIDPFFFISEIDEKDKKPGHLIDLLRSLILAVLNYIEIVLIFSAFYKFLPIESFNTPIIGFDLFYFSLVTITTLGYGDIRPCPGSLLAKILITIELILGLTFIIIVLGTIIPNFIKMYGGQRKNAK